MALTEDDKRWIREEITMQLRKGFSESEKKLITDEVRMQLDRRTLH